MDELFLYIYFNEYHATRARSQPKSIVREDGGQAREGVEEMKEVVTAIAKGDLDELRVNTVSTHPEHSLRNETLPYGGADARA